MDSIWLQRPGPDGGVDYVCFRRPQQGRVEMLEGHHLPPQLPLLKRRTWIGSDQLSVCRKVFEQDHGYRHSPPLF
ncbi:MAG: hypothetical protein EBZ29_04730 [Synechococcaceae bacterium WB9_4xC_028]|nr:MULTISPECIES: hypothetical protein [unclassified Synechococcus]NDD44834.1 hypothetical protein [Synechococcaceae bacterium WB9_4xB_025]NDD68705.1 hypothetical protein [Synechococcaceae bacterium WB9_4xC_028]TCD55447.1 hypothetical protein CWE17_11705 [Synechococcus sp. BS56D]TCD57301.1 hypothetical protein CWE16_06045 [Synechococcus sp. BS55D]